jgi:hypothetical protein
VLIAELQISWVFAFFTLWKRVKMHVLSDQSVHITHTYSCVSKLSKFGAYLYSRVHVHNNTFLSLRNSPKLLPFILFEGESVYVTRHRWNYQELKYKIFRSALALSSTLIHVLAHFQQTRGSQIYFRFSSYLLCKPHLFVILTAIGWFIINIQSDLFWHRCLERQAFCTPRMYTLSIGPTNFKKSVILYQSSR